MNTTKAGVFLLVTSGIVALPLISPLLLVLPILVGVFLIFAGARDMSAGSPTQDPGR